MGNNFEIKVFISLRDSTCSECKENLGHKAWITLDHNKGALCLSCADMEHLIFLPAGDAALTRRAKKHSKFSAIVLKWSRNRKRYERQGILIDSEALEKAEEECLQDNQLREKRREREAINREEIDRQFIEDFDKRIREIFPGCPTGREKEISEHACLKYSGRVGRSKAAKDFSEQAVRLAVIAHIRHIETEYDELLGRSFERYDARSKVEEEVNLILTKWEDI